MKSLSRRHHYIPQSYLAAFTDTKKKTGSLHVFDIIRKKKFKTSPVNIALERDFNKIEIDACPIDALENKLSEFEGNIISSLNAVNATLKFPDSEQLNDILNLLCLLAVRNPKTRDQFNHFRRQSHDMLSDLLVQNKKIYQNAIISARRRGFIKDSDRDIEYEEMLGFIKNRRYKIEIPTQANIVVEFSLFDKILQLLGERHWSILISSCFCPEFICSDHPVTLVSKNQQHYYGYGSRNTEIFFPIGPRICLYGTFEDPLKYTVYPNAKKVASINNVIADNARSCIYSSRETFYILTQGSITQIAQI